MNKKTVSIVGLGKLGACMAAAIASRGVRVIGVDVNTNAIDMLNAGTAPVQETSLQEYIDRNQDRLSATLSHRDAVMQSDITFVIVPTPSEQNGSFSLRFAQSAFAAIGAALKEKKNYHTVVLTSTVLPGSTRYGLLPTLERESGKKCGKDFGLCYSPEFIALGSVIHDFLNPDFLLVGEFDKHSGDILEECYEKIMENHPPCKRMTIENAELTKIALNTFVTTKITYANMLTALCDRIPGGDVDVVSDALGLDKRVGRKYLTGGLGYGGPCFPRDNVALSYLAQSLGVANDLVVATDRCNRMIPENEVARLKKIIKKGSTIAVLGLAYKPMSCVIEESQGMDIVHALLTMDDVKVTGFDPCANDAAQRELGDRIVIQNSITECLRDADAVLITTPDPAFYNLSAHDFHNDKKTIIVVDFWRILSKKLKNDPKIRYIPIGQSYNDPENAKVLEKMWRDRTSLP